MRTRIEVLHWIEQAEQDWLVLDQKRWKDKSRVHMERAQQREVDNELRQLCNYGNDRNLIDHYSNSVVARARNMTLNNEDREYDFVMAAVLQREFMKRMSYAPMQPLQEQRDSVQPELTKGKNYGG